MSPAKPADPQIRSSIRERTDCISLPATPAALDEVSLRSRPVSPHKSERDADSKVREDREIGCLFTSESGNLPDQMEDAHRALPGEVGLLRPCKHVLLKEVQVQYKHRRSICET